MKIIIIFINSIFCWIQITLCRYNYIIRLVWLTLWWYVIEFLIIIILLYYHLRPSVLKTKETVNIILAVTFKLVCVGVQETRWRLGVRGGHRRSTGTVHSTWIRDARWSINTAADVTGVPTRHWPPQSQSSSRWMGSRCAEVVALCVRVMIVGRQV